MSAGAQGGNPHAQMPHSSAGGSGTSRGAASFSPAAFRGICIAMISDLAV